MKDSVLKSRSLGLICALSAFLLSTYYMPSTEITSEKTIVGKNIHNPLSPYSQGTQSWQGAGGKKFHEGKQLRNRLSPQAGDAKQEGRHLGLRRKPRKIAYFWLTPWPGASISLPWYPHRQAGSLPFVIFVHRVKCSSVSGPGRGGTEYHRARHLKQAHPCSDPDPAAQGLHIFGLCHSSFVGPHHCCL